MIYRNRQIVLSGAELYCLLKRSIVVVMKSTRRCLLFVLLLAFPLSTWAGMYMPCAQEKAPLQVQGAVTGDEHSHHGSTVIDADTQGDGSAAIDCSCCGDCVTMCAMSGCMSAAIASQNFDISYGGGITSNPPQSRHHANPTPHPLFRPPISNT